MFKVIPGPPHEQNKKAIDWHPSNILAYGCQSYVVIVDPIQLKIVQTLDHHPSNVIRVKWCNKILTQSNYIDNEKKPFSLLLASGDTMGTILVFDVNSSSVVASLGDDKGKPISSLQDLAWHPTKSHLLASIHKKSVILWNISTKQKLWESVFKEPIITLRFNPFDSHHLCVATELGWIYFVRDFNENSQPRQIELKYRVSGAPSDAEKNDFQEMIFSPQARNIMYFVLKRRILVFDISIHQAIGTVSMDRNKSSFVQVIPCHHKLQILFGLHEDGSISCWRKRESTYVYDMECTLDLVSYNLQLRKTNYTLLTVDNSKNPQYENLIAALRSDGTMFILNYKERLMHFVEKTVTEKSRPRRSSTPTRGRPFPKGIPVATSKSMTITRSSVAALTQNTSQNTVEPVKPPPPSWEVIQPARLMIVGNLSNLSSSVSSLAVNQFDGYNHLMAVGTQLGSIQLVDSKKTHIFAEHKTALNVPIRGLKWLDPQRLIFFCIEQCEKNMFKNHIYILNTTTGRFGFIRKKNEPEMFYIRAIRPSNLGKYVIVLIKEQPFQIWDLETGSLIKSIKPFMQVTAMAWAPPTIIGPNTYRESFVFTTPDSSVHYYHIENNSITPASLQASLAMGLINSLVWQGPFLVSGDNTGTIYVWNFEKKRLAGFPALERGATIRRIHFAPGAPQPPPPIKRTLSTIQSSSSLRISSFLVKSPSSAELSPKTTQQSPQRIMVHFTNGSFGIWDLDNNVRLSSGAHLSQRGINATAIEWLSYHQPVIVCSDGAIRIMDQTLSLSNCPIQSYSLLKPLHSPLLLPEKVALTLKILLMNMCLTGDAEEGFQDLLSSVDYSLMEKLKFITKNSDENTKSASFIECNILIAEFFGNTFEIQFWNIALHLIQSKTPLKLRTVDNEKDENDQQSKEDDTLPPLNNASINEQQHVEVVKEIEVENDVNNMPDHLDLLLDSSRIKKQQHEHANIHMERKTLQSDPHLTRKIAEFQLLLGRRTEAAGLLLSNATTTENPQNFTDALLACVIAATVDKKTFHNTVKLVATNLIAQDRLDTGIQLLSLIGKGLDACRDLQTYDRWTEAAWLAKVSLPNDESTIVMKRWANHLLHTGDRENIMYAILILLSLGEVELVLELLLKNAEFIDVGAYFAIITQFDRKTPQFTATCSKIIETFTKVLINLGMDSLAEKFKSQENIQSNDKSKEKINEVMEIVEEKNTDSQWESY